MEFLKDKKVIITLILFLILKIIFVLKQGDFALENIQGDALTYHTFAYNLLDNPLTFIDFDGHYRPPGYPILLAFFYGIFGKENLLIVYIFQAFLSLGVAYLIYKISEAIFDKRVAFLALLWACLYPSYFLFSIKILRETLVFFQILLSFYFLLKIFFEKEKTNLLSSKYFWLFSFSFSFLIHIDPRYFFFFPFILLITLIYLGRERVIYNWIVLSVFLLVSIIPWTVRNYKAYGGFVLINTRTLDLSGTEKEVDRFKLSNDKISGELINKKYPSVEERELIKQGKNLNKRSKAEVEAILDGKEATKNPLLKRIYNFTELWQPVRLTSTYRPFNDCRFEKAWSLKHNLLSFLSFGILLVPMLFGIVSLFREKNKWLLFLITPIILQTVLHVLMWGKERYRIPIDSFVIILGCYGMIEIYNKLKTVIAKT